MRSEVFADLFREQIALCETVMGVKAKEYATDDRLFNFKTASALRHVTPVEALGGMMVKHTVSIYDMIESGEDYPQEVWNEKITDHINYLILLRALLYEKAMEDQAIVDSTPQLFGHTFRSNIPS